MFPPPSLDDQQPRDPKPSRRRGVVLALTAVAAVLGGFVGAQIAQSGDDASSTDVVMTDDSMAPSDVSMAPSEVGSTGAPVVTAPATDDRLPVMDVANVVEIIEPSVVTVVSEIDEGFGMGQGTGTGVVITADGEILTNAHVVDGEIGRASCRERVFGYV